METLLPLPLPIYCPEPPEKTLARLVRLVNKRPGDSGAILLPLEAPHAKIETRYIHTNLSRIGMRVDNSGYIPKEPNPAAAWFGDNSPQTQKTLPQTPKPSQNLFEAGKIPRRPFAAATLARAAQSPTWLSDKILAPCGLTTPPDKPAAKTAHTIVQPRKPEIRLTGSRAQLGHALNRQSFQNPNGEYKHGLHRRKEKITQRLAKSAIRLGSIGLRATAASLPFFAVIDKVMT